MIANKKLFLFDISRQQGLRLMGLTLSKVTRQPVFALPVGGWSSWVS